MSNWSKKSGVKLNDYLAARIKELADSLSFDIVITSGIRGARSQARAMLNNKRMFDQMRDDGVIRTEKPRIPYIVNYLVDLYADDSFAWAIENTYPQSPQPYTTDQLEAATAIVQAQIDAGAKGHSAGLAFDTAYYSPQGLGSFHRDNLYWLDADQIAEFVSTAKFFDYDVDKEFDHFHTVLPEGLTDETEDTADSKKNLALLILPLVGVLLWTMKK